MRKCPNCGKPLVVVGLTANEKIHTKCSDNKPTGCQSTFFMEPDALGDPSIYLNLKKERDANKT